MIVAVVFAYLLIMLGIGYFASRRIGSNEDFMVAGRRLGPILMAGTLAATEIGGGSSMGVVEKAYGDWGISASWYVITMAITFLILAFIAPRLRNSMVKTIPEFFRRRYGEAPGAITAVIMILPLVGLTATQFIASAVVLSVMIGIPYHIAVLIVAVVVTGYSIMGGLWSVTLTDFVQIFLIVAGMAIAIPYAMHACGGWEGIVSQVPPAKLSLTAGIGVKTILSLIVMYTVSFCVGQEAVQRYYAAKTDKTALGGSLLASAIYVIFAAIPTVLGLACFVLVKNGTIDGAMIQAYGAKYALPSLALQIMPPVLTGFLFAGLISATMSSADSDMLGAGSIFANDIYRIYIRPKANDKEVMRVTQISMGLIGLVATLVALANTQSIIALLMFSFSLRAGGSFMPFVCGHYWRKASWAGAMTSLIFGSATVILFQYTPLDFWGLEPIFPGLLVSLIVFVVFSNLYPGKTKTPLPSSGA